MVSYSVELQRHNSGSNGSVSASQKVASNKEAAHPGYQMQDRESGNGVLSGVSYIVCQRQTVAAAATDSHTGEGGRMGLA